MAVSFGGPMRTAWATILTVCLLAGLDIDGVRAEAQGETGAPPASSESLSLLQALTLMLEQDPNVALARTDVESAEGRLDVERADFDPLLSGSAGFEDSETPTSETSVTVVDAQSAGVTVSQLFRSGLSVSGDLDITRSDGEPEATNIGSISFTVRQPLARGRGRDVVTANERSSELSFEASRLDLEHRIAERVLAVATQYWSVVSAAADLEILRSNYDRASDAFENYKRLVAADQVPAADLVQLEADVVSRQVAMLSAEQTLFARRQTLGFEIGLDARASAALPLPGDAFPRVESERLPDPLDGDLIDGALAQRADLQALENRRQSSEVLLTAAENALLPRLDLVLTPSYTGLTEDDGFGGLFSSLTDNVPGVSATFGLSFSWPLRNRSAEGLYQQSAAGLERRDLQIDLLANSITSQVTTAVDAVRASSEQLELAIRAVSLFERALENEQKKLRASRSTLLDTITQRDRLTSAQQRQNSAEFALALALVRLRFQTGTLFEAAGDGISFDFDRLTTVPATSRR